MKKVFISLVCLSVVFLSVTTSHALAQLEKSLVQVKENKSGRVSTGVFILFVDGAEMEQEDLDYLSGFVLMPFHGGPLVGSDVDISLGFPFEETTKAKEVVESDAETGMALIKAKIPKGMVPAKIKKDRFEGKEGISSWSLQTSSETIYEPVLYKDCCSGCTFTAYVRRTVQRMKVVRSADLENSRGVIATENGEVIGIK